MVCSIVDDLASPECSSPVVPIAIGGGKRVCSLPATLLRPTILSASTLSVIHPSHDALIASKSFSFLLRAGGLGGQQEGTCRVGSQEECQHYDRLRQAAQTEWSNSRSSACVFCFRSLPLSYLCFMPLSLLALYQSGVLSIK